MSDDERDRGFVGQFLVHAASLLQERPAYIFVLGIASLLATGGTFYQQDRTVALCGIIALTVLALFLVERNTRSVVVDSPGERKGIEQIAKWNLSINAVFEGAVAPDSDVYVVHPTLLTREMFDESGRKIELTPPERAWRVTGFLDTQGTAKVQGTMYAAGKHGKIHAVTAETFDSRWDAHVILVGGPIANRRTQEVLSQFNLPFRFDNSGSSPVIHSADGQGGIWPGHDDPLDYGIVAKVKRVHADKELVYLIAAGNTSDSTLACCEYLTNDVAELAEQFGRSSFACVISVDRAAGIPHLVTSVRLA